MVEDCNANSLRDDAAAPSGSHWQPRGPRAHAQRRRFNSVNKVGRTALMLEAASGHVGIVDLLIAKRANLHATCENRRTAMGYAVANGLIAIVQRLVEAGANMERIDRDRNSALMGAIYHRHWNMVTYLLTPRANVNATNANCETSLTAACRLDLPKVVETLLKAGARINVEIYETHETPLKIAARNVIDHVVRTLIAHSAVVAVTPPERDFCALMSAIEGGHARVVKQLLDAGAVVEHFDIRPLLLAAH